MRTVDYAKDPIYYDYDESKIILTVKFFELSKEVPFLADPADPEPWGREIYADARAGKYGRIKPPKPAPNPMREMEKAQSDSETSAKMLQKANAKLRENSHLVTPEIQALMEPESAAAARDYVKKLGEIIGKAQLALENKKRYSVDLPDLRVKFKSGK